MLGVASGARPLRRGGDEKEGGESGEGVAARLVVVEKGEERKRLARDGFGGLMLRLKEMLYTLCQRRHGLCRHVKCSPAVRCVMPAQGIVRQQLFVVNVEAIFRGVIVGRRRRRADAGRGGYGGRIGRVT